ncbi:MULTISPECIES: hypothetical protein [Streptomyces]|uniref:Uncharacterized protein n=1 Tax=Streptomyces evansiae TaxID=3075535 RepID=A0ABU2QZQ6_9ACTN|nr:MULTISPECIES: hypothetical protein [unclassified Streptomyces]MDT0409948.1 hypothetical protein [Streptomyces sp. DSM 41979]MYQ59965.1 hypothetical protein [Streptomyces sp. SID4926]SCE40791.1 hypothetical protein GA0115252_146461 [Streptomyces sp. DfronAA-171]
MIRYRNENNGEVVEREKPDARLDFLTNWERLEDGETPGPVKPDGVLSRPQVSPGVAEQDATDEELEEREADEPPARSASKAEWQEYARERAVSDEERAEVDTLTKELLVAKYGTVADG